MPSRRSRSRNFRATLSSPNIGLCDRRRAGSLPISRVGRAWLPTAKAVVQRERLTHDLIHVVVSIGRQPADKRDVLLSFRKFLIGRVQGRVLRSWDWIIGIAIFAREFVAD